ncbi:MAG: hypothetical protein WEE64_10665 [Dehalococcoidia bacterium]
MGIRKTYEKPVLLPYGDIRAITTMPKNKTFGAGDGLVVFENQDILQTIS